MKKNEKDTFLRLKNCIRSELILYSVLSCDGATEKGDVLAEYPRSFDSTYQNYIGNKTYSQMDTTIQKRTV